MGANDLMSYLPVKRQVMLGMVVATSVHHAKSGLYRRADGPQPKNTLREDG